MDKFKVALVGATGMVGQRFITLLEGHPWFELSCVAASGRSAGKTYEEAAGDRWTQAQPIPERVKVMTVLNGEDVNTVSADVDFVFCAVEMPKEATRALEDAYALAETPVISNNSAHRMTPDVPMMVPEVNPHHSVVIEHYRKRMGVRSGFIAVKPNCSIQGYVPPLTALWDFAPEKISVCTYQAISGAGKTFAMWPEMVDNVIPLIPGEELKSEQEPLRIWGDVVEGVIVPVAVPIISAQCYRVPVTDGHMAAVSVSFKQKPDIDTILNRWAAFEGEPQKLGLPSAPGKFVTYFTEENRPQTKLDRDLERGMGISVGRLREDAIFDYKFVSLSHNTLRGAAGGAVLTAELLVKQGYLTRK